MCDLQDAWQYGIRRLNTAVTTYHKTKPHKTEPRPSIARLLLMPCCYYFDVLDLFVYVVALWWWRLGGAYGWNICSRWSRNTNPMCYLVAGVSSLTASLELSPCR